MRIREKNVLILDKKFRKLFNFFSDTVKTSWKAALSNRSKTDPTGDNMNPNKAGYDVIKAKGYDFFKLSTSY